MSQINRFLDRNNGDFAENCDENAKKCAQCSQVAQNISINAPKKCTQNAQKNTLFFPSKNSRLGTIIDEIN